MVEAYSSKKAKAIANREMYGDARLVATRKSAINYAMRRGSTLEDAEDFAGFVMLRALSGSGVPHLGYLFIDYQRKCVTNIKNDADRERSKAIRFMTQYVEELSDESTHPEIVLGCKDETRDKAHVFQFVEENKLSTHERICLILAVHYGLTYKEVGGVIGVTESRVCQTVRGIGNRLTSAE